MFGKILFKIGQLLFILASIDLKKKTSYAPTNAICVVEWTKTQKKTLLARVCGKRVSRAVLDYIEVDYMSRLR